MVSSISCIDQRAHCSFVVMSRDITYLCAVTEQTARRTNSEDICREALSVRLVTFLPRVGDVHMLTMWTPQTTPQLDPTTLRRAEATQAYASPLTRSLSCTTIRLAALSSRVVPIGWTLGVIMHGVPGSLSPLRLAVELSRQARGRAEHSRRLRWVSHFQCSGYN